MTRFLASICWKTYCRSFLITLGLLFLGLTGLLGKGLLSEADAPAWTLLPIAACAGLGGFLVWTGACFSNARVEALAEDASRGDLEVFLVMLIALPMYGLMRALQKRR